MQLAPEAHRWTQFFVGQVKIQLAPAPHVWMHFPPGHTNVQFAPAAHVCRHPAVSHALVQREPAPHVCVHGSPPIFSAGHVIVQDFPAPQEPGPWMMPSAASVSSAVLVAAVPAVVTPGVERAPPTVGGRRCSSALRLASSHDSPANISQPETTVTNKTASPTTHRPRMRRDYRVGVVPARAILWTWTESSRSRSAPSAADVSWRSRARA